MVKSCFGANYREVEIGEIVTLARNEPLTLECGVKISNFPLAFQTYGTLNAKRSNAILICHALTGGPVCGWNPPGYGQTRLVGQDGRARAAYRYQPVFCDLFERDRQLYGLIWAKGKRPRDGRDDGA